MFLVLSSLGEKHKTLACLGGMRSIRMANVLRFLVAKVCSKMLVLEGSVTEPEVLLREDETPERKSLLAILWVWG